MRDIKFRAWNGSHMLDWEWLCAMGQIGANFFNKDLPNKGYDLMQYTGLHDKNGKEIYEGDILTVQTKVNSKGQVVWSDKWHGFCLLLNNQFGAPYPILIDENKKPIEVIGNVSENPELVKE